MKTLRQLIEEILRRLESLEEMLGDEDEQEYEEMEEA